MFSFRCYCCGATLGRGLPPLDALSDDQIQGVNMTIWNEETNTTESTLTNEELFEQKQKSRTLKGTRFEGMSAGSFCSFCLVWALEFPGATKDRFDFSTMMAEVLACGHVSHADTNMHAFINRLMSFRSAEEMYKGAEAKPMLDMLRSLLKEDITYTYIPCWWPECTKQERILLPEDRKGCEDHAYFLRPFQTLTTEREKHEFVSMGHKDCECDSCMWLYWDNWDADREEYEQMRWEEKN